MRESEQFFGLQAESTLQGRAITVRMKGSAENDEAAPLAEYLAKLDHKLRDENLVMAVVDVSGVEFMNSTSLKSFVTWLVRADDGNGAYRVRFRYTADIFWQRRSIESLHRLAPGVVIDPETSADD